MLIIIRLLVIVAVVLVLIRLLRGSGSRSGRRSGGRSGRRSGGRRERFPCATCRHCGALYDDGVLCRYEDKQTFKNPTHIANCMDYEEDTGGKGRW